MEENSTVEPVADDTTITLVTDIIAAYVSNNSVPVVELPSLIASVHSTLKGLERGAGAEPQIDKATPAQIRKSITPDALISFVDGKPYKTLKRHLTGHGLTIEEYRERYGLPRDYPSVAASYSEARSNLAKSTGLGIGRRKAAPKLAVVAETIAEPPKAAEAASKPTRARKPKEGGGAGRGRRVEPEVPPQDLSRSGGLGPFVSRFPCDLGRRTQPTFGHVEDGDGHQEQRAERPCDHKLHAEPPDETPSERVGFYSRRCSSDYKLGHLCRPGSKITTPRSVAHLPQSLAVSSHYVKIEGMWPTAPLCEVRRHHTMAPKRCPVCHGRIILARNYTTTGGSKLQHRRSHRGRSLTPVYTGVPTRHSQAID